MVSEMRTLHQARAANNPDFIYRRNALAYRKVRNDTNTVTLNEAQRIREKNEAEVFWLKLENEKRLAQGRDILKSLDELNDANENIVAKNEVQSQPGISSSDESDESDGSLIGNEVAGVVDPTALMTQDRKDAVSTSEDSEPEQEKIPDPYLVETSKIILDLISLQKRTAEKQSSQRI